MMIHIHSEGFKQLEKVDIFRVLFLETKDSV